LGRPDDIEINAMDPESGKQAIIRRKRSSSKPVAVCDQEIWPDPADLEDSTIASGRDDGSISETEGLLFALGQAVEQRDHHLAGHCERLAFIGVALGMSLRLDRVSLLALYRGGFLHDVGKIGIPDSILFKPGTLTAEEWTIMRSHCARGEEICRHLKTLRPVLPIIRHHHERWDGSGYPDGLRQQQIPLLARVLQIADIYDALTSPRAYKAAYSADKALVIIKEEASRGWRDPELVEMFLRVHKGALAKIAYYDNQANGNAAALRNSLADLHALMDAVA
jgi:response regulator RpfG family c-di-GMP phosphodiesterase